MAKTTRRHRNIVDQVPSGLGVYEFWNYGRGRNYAFPHLASPAKYLTALAELPPAENSGQKLPPIKRNGTQVLLPTLWKAKWPDETEFKPRFFPFVIAKSKQEMKVQENPEKLRELLLSGITEPKIRKFLGSVDLKRSRLRVGLPVKDDAVLANPRFEPTSPQWAPDAGLRARIGREKRITIIAIIDDGLPFAHRNFRDATGARTRVEFCWQQSATAGDRSVLFGREYTRGQIESAIARHGDDEDTLYRTLRATEETEGLASLLRRHATHGAHVMDLATGYAAEHGESPAEEIRIIAVQLPNLLTMDTSGVGKDMYLLSAFHYIFHRADLIAHGYSIERPRLVINFSYGYFGGSHDGQIDSEAAICELIHARRKLRGPTALVLPAGNSFLDRMHARVPEDKLATGQACLPWRMQPADRTPNYVELWFPPEFDPTGYTVAMRDPSGNGRGHVTIARPGKAKRRDDDNDDDDNGSYAAVVFDHSQPVGLISVDHHRGKRWRVMIATAPTETRDPSNRGITPGVWTIVITREANARPLPQAIHCWIQRDTDPEGLRSGARQSYFDDLRDVRYNCDGSPREVDTTEAFVQRFGSLNGLATQDASIVVAGFRLTAGLGSSAQQIRAVRYSCAGPHNEELPEATIDCASMSDRAMALPGTVAAGVRSGSRSILNGTSVAAPVVARQLVTTFVRAGEAAVEEAEQFNYLPLLDGAPPPAGRKLTERLGEVIVAPYRQLDLGASLLREKSGSRTSGT